MIVVWQGTIRKTAILLTLYCIYTPLKIKQMRHTETLLTLAFIAVAIFSLYSGNL